MTTPFGKGRSQTLGVYRKDNGKNPSFKLFSISMRTKSSLGFITDSLRVTAPKFPILQLYKLTMFFTPRCPGGHETGRRAKWSSSHLEAPLTGQNMMAWPLKLISDPIRGFKYWDAKPTCPIMSWHFFRESLWCKLACGVQNSCCWQFHWRIWDPTSWKPQFFSETPGIKGAIRLK